MHGSRKKLRTGKSVINGTITVPLLENVRRDGLVLLAAQPAAAMDVDEQRRRFLRLNLPEIELHVLVGTVGDMLVSRLDVLGQERRCRDG
jgi:hypothetical protein